MKNINKKLNILLVALVLFVPVFANADWDYSGYGNYYDDYSGYGNYYDDYSGYGNYYDDYYYDDYSGYGNYYDDYYYDDYSGYGNYYDDYYYDYYYDDYYEEYYYDEYYYDDYYYDNYYQDDYYYCGSYCDREVIVDREVVIIDNDDLDVTCELSDSRIEEGDRVRIEVDIDGGDSPFDIEWSGDADDIDDFDDDERSQYVRVDDEGTYRLRVTVEDDDGNRDSDTCTLYVEDDTRGVFSSNTYDYPTGNFASVGSVYLNQVPYTGPVDTAKLIGFITLVLLWSFAGAYMIRKRMKRNEASKRMQEFKNMNRQAQEIN